MSDWLLKALDVYIDWPWMIGRWWKRRKEPPMPFTNVYSAPPSMAWLGIPPFVN